MLCTEAGPCQVLQQGFMVGSLDLSPLAGTDGNWTDHLLAEVLGFFWTGYHIGGCKATGA